MSSFEDLVRFSNGKPREEKLSLKGGRHRQLREYKAKTSPGKTGVSQQRVTVKVNYAEAGNGKSVAQKFSGHLSYLTRDGAGIDGQKAELFGEPGKTLNLNPEIEGEQRFFRVMVSPENGSQIQDMKEYTQGFMSDVERTTGQKLEWFAAVHDNTNHPHVHIVIRGVDQNGKEFVMDPRLIKEGGLRKIAQDHATMELGSRTKDEISLQKQREITQERLTGLDRTLLGQADRANRVIPENQRQRDRLAFLETLGLAKGEKFGRYELNEGMEKRLQFMGKKDDIQKRVFETIGKDMYPGARIYPVGKGNVSGEVIKKGMEDEMRDKSFAVIKSETAKGVSLHYYNKADVGDLKVGDRVKIAQGEVSKPEKEIEMKQRQVKGVER